MSKIKIVQKSKKTKRTPKWCLLGSRINIAGVQYADYCLLSRDSYKAGTVLTLVGELSNPYDSKAVRVELQGVKLGYLPKGSLEQQQVWTAHASGRKCIAILTGFHPTNPTHMMFVIQCKATVPVVRYSGVDEVTL